MLPICYQPELASIGITTPPIQNTARRMGFGLQLPPQLRSLKLVRAFLWDNLHGARYTVNAGSAFQSAAAKLTAPHLRGQTTPLARIQRGEGVISNIHGGPFL